MDLALHRRAFTEQERARLLERARAVLALASAFALSGCVPPAQVPEEAKEIRTEVILQAPIDAVWDAAVEWFARGGIPIKNLDRASGLITTEHSMSIDQALELMFCGPAEISPSKRTEYVDHRGNFNLLLRQQPDGTTRASVNAFFSCTVNFYREVGFLVTEMQLASTERRDCKSTGGLEERLLGHLSTIRVARPAASPPPEPVPVAAPTPEPAPAGTAAPTPPIAPTACTSDADCRAGRVCRDGTCTTPGCAKDVDCPEPQICEAGACKLP